MNLEIARTNMLKQQLRTNDIIDQDLLTLLSTTPREQFVPEAYRAFAFADMHIPLEHDQMMLTPLEEAHIISALAIQTSETVLEIGTGTGYLTALMAQLAKHVYSIDHFADFTITAEQRLHALSIANTTLITADGVKGLVEHAPFDIIVIAGSISEIPETIKQQLNPSTGRLFAIIGEAPTMQATVFTARPQTVEWDKKCLYTTVVPKMLNFPQKDNFVF